MLVSGGGLIGLLDSLLSVVGCSELGEPGLLVGLDSSGVVFVASGVPPEPLVGGFPSGNCDGVPAASDDRPQPGTAYA